MNNRFFFALWGVLLAICAGLGFIPEPEGALGTAMTILALASFLPPMVLVYRAKQSRNRRNLALIRNLSLASLILTVILVILNFLSFTASESWGNFIYYVLVTATTPMVCGRYWALSLFLWAYLMVDCTAALRKKT